MEDNARKFTLGNIDPEFLKTHTAVSYTLILDWIATGPNEDKKIAYKKFEDGKSQILLVSKVMQNGSRIVEKKNISEEEYKELLKSSRFHVEKRRYEINFIQNENSFLLKYDEFSNSGLRVLEVDAPTEEARASFDPEQFPYPLSEVTGNAQYYAHRVTEVV